MHKKQGDFELEIEPGTFHSSQIVVMLGENGTGKTTFIKMLAGKSKEETKDKEEFDIPEMNVSYKPQTIAPKFEGSVRELLTNRYKDLWMHPQFSSDVTKPLKLDEILDNEVLKLSGGELQRVAIILALCKPADVYLIDEPSAYLDSEQRVICARVIKRFIINSKKAAFIVEHDFIMSSYLADLYHPLLIQSHRVRRCPRREMQGQRPSEPGERNEQIPEPAEHHLSTRPHQLPAAHQQAGIPAGQGAEAQRKLLLPGGVMEGVYVPICLLQSVCVLVQ